jgi:hypothetical protein
MSACFVGPNCQECAKADANPRHATFAGKCSECQARMLAHSHEAKDARNLRQMTAAYRRALENMFGETWLAGHQRVKAWAGRISGERG